MCCLFGILDHQGRLSLPRRRQMLAVLARECEARGTDTAEIAYCVNRHISVYKAPMPAHLVNFQPPAQVRFIMGHTRMATQGDEHQNYNNHPFKGRAGNTSFALAHNGVIHNDQLLKVQHQLPKLRLFTEATLQATIRLRHFHLVFSPDEKNWLEREYKKEKLVIPFSQPAAKRA